MSSPRPASSTSPWTIFDWPSGVPVIITSFGSSVIYCDVYDISSGTLYHRSRVLPFCFNSPFTRSHRSTLWQSGISCFDMNLDTGLAVSKPFPRLQGKPFCRAGPYKWKSISRCLYQFKSALQTNQFTASSQVQSQTITTDVFHRLIHGDIFTFLSNDNAQFDFMQYIREHTWQLQTQNGDFYYSI